ncbi:hypothetical protein PR048_007443 [Dryococelus australis]|uniref:Uncharacterized protein n=1 Tax=Dryococelus australis TaxID=614101 RepID=A0ABQ9HUB0_9NEOP|nr:hypothetical protein PR048_007443 [Dryococelus australis]
MKKGSRPRTEWAPISLRRTPYARRDAPAGRLPTCLASQRFNWAGVEWPALPAIQAHMSPRHSLHFFITIIFTQLTLCIQLSCSTCNFEADKCGSYKDDTATHCKYAIVPKRKALRCLLVNQCRNHPLSVSAMRTPWRAHRTTRACQGDANNTVVGRPPLTTLPSHPARYYTLLRVPNTARAGVAAGWRVLHHIVYSRLLCLHSWATPHLPLLRYTRSQHAHECLGGDYWRPPTWASRSPTTTQWMDVSAYTLHLILAVWWLMYSVSFRQEFPSPGKVGKHSHPRTSLSLGLHSAVSEGVSWPALNTEVLRADEGEARSPRKPTEQRRRWARFPLAINPGVTRPGIEPGSPWWEASRLTAQQPWPQRINKNANSWLQRGWACVLLAGLSPPGDKSTSRVSTGGREEDYSAGAFKSVQFPGLNRTNRHRVFESARVLPRTDCTKADPRPRCDLAG